MSAPTKTKQIQDELEGKNADTPKDYNKINKGGRPAKYKVLTDLQKAIDKYFLDCDNRIVEEWDGVLHQTVKKNIPEPYTMSGLAYSIGMDRQGILNYSRKRMFFDAIKRARQRVNLDVEKRLMEGKNQVGAIFSLKNNFNWIDKTEVDNNIRSDKVGGFVVVKPESATATKPEKEKVEVPEEEILKDVASKPAPMVN
jgi:hypothetical protein